MIETTIETTSYLTENDLVGLIQERGFTEVNQRLFGEWRRKGLLPKFDKIGKGLGKGAGRVESSWSNPKSIVIQTLWILRLRKFYRNYSDMYFPLWVLGCKIPYTKVFYSLCQPLNYLLKDLKAAIKRFKATDDEFRADDGGYIEDYISEAADNYIAYENSRDPNKGYAGSESLEIGMNLIFNPAYRISHEDLKIINSDSSGSRKMSEMADSVALIGDQTLNLLVQHAHFIQQNLSLHRFRSVMDRCTRKELEEVRADLQAVSEIISVVSELTNIYMQDVRQELKPESMDALLPLLLSTAKLFVWIDLSLRHAGFGEVINHFRGQLPNLIMELSSADLRAEVAKSSPSYALKAEKNALELEELFNHDPIIKRLRKKSEKKGDK